MAALLVLLSHLVQIEGRTVDAPILPESFTYGMLGVDLFFVISGFIMVFVTRDWDKPGRVGEFLFSRAARIYPLYWFVSAAVFAVWIIRPELVFSSSPNQPNPLNSVLLFPSFAYPLLEVGWTLVYEMGFYFIFALLLLLPGRFRPFGLLVWAGTVAVGLSLGWQTANAVAFHLINPLSFQFLAGAAMGLAFLRWDGSALLGWILFIAGGLSLGLWLVIGGAVFDDGWARVIRFTPPAAALVLGAALLDRHGVSASKYWVRLGDWSYSLYLTHLLSLVLVSKLWRVLDLGLSPVFLLIAVVFAIIIAGLTYRIVEAPLHEGARKIRRRLFTPPDPQFR